MHKVEEYYTKKAIPFKTRKSGFKTFRAISGFSYGNEGKISLCAK